MDGCLVQVVTQEAKGGVYFTRLGSATNARTTPKTESFQDRLKWAIRIQDAQTDLRLRRTSFPNLGLLGDYIFLYDQEKELELQTEEDELWLKEYKKKMRAHIQEIIYSSMISEQEREWMKEYASQSMTDQTYDNEDRYLERIIMPNLFEMRRNSHN